MMKKILNAHPVATFTWMFCSALAFGLSSYNLFFLVHANIDLIAENGFMALQDGALMQLAMLFGYGVISLATYVIFKACEKLMVDAVLTSK